jgi:hypothetical protein
MINYADVGLPTGLAVDKLRAEANSTPTDRDQWPIAKHRDNCALVQGPAGKNDAQERTSLFSTGRARSCLFTEGVLTLYRRHGRESFAF